MERLGMVVYSLGEAQHRQLLALNGRLLSNGETIQVKKLEPHLALSEMRQICHDTLQPKEHVQEMKAAGGGNRIAPRYPPALHKWQLCMMKKTRQVMGSRSLWLWWASRGPHSRGVARPHPKRLPMPQCLSPVVHQDPPTKSRQGESERAQATKCPECPRCLPKITRRDQKRHPRPHQFC